MNTNKSFLSKNKNENYSDFSGGDEDMSKRGLYLSIGVLILSALFLLMSQGILGMILVGFSGICFICSILQLIFNCKEAKETDYYLTFLFFNEWHIWFGAVAAFYFIGTIKSILFPLFIAAANKEDWDNYYWSWMSYEAFMGLFITFIPLFVFGIGWLSGHNLYNFHMYEGTIAENLDRTMSSIVIIELLFTFSFAIILKFEGIWNTFYFAVMLYILIGISILYLLVSLYFGMCRRDNDGYDNVRGGLYMFLIFMFVYHVVMAIIVFSNPTNLKSSTPAAFSNNYDQSFLKNYYNEEKYYFTGNEEKIAECPKYFSVYSWEDPDNSFGCLNMKAFYRGREVVCLLLDILIIIPLFEILLLYCLQDIDETSGGAIKSNKKYIKYQEKMRIGVSWFISIAIVVGTLFILCWSNFTKSGKFLKKNIEPANINNHALKWQIIPPSTINNNNNNGLLYDLNSNSRIMLNATNANEEIIYTVTGNVDTVIRKYTIHITSIKDGKVDKKEFDSSQDFKLELIGETKVPTTYNLKIQLDQETETVNFGNIIIGGLISGKTIKLGTIPIKGNILKPLTNLTGIVMDPKEKDEVIKDANVYLLEGYHHYPLIESDLDTKSKFEILNPFRYHKTYFNGKYNFFAIPQGYYTLVIYKENYYIEVIHFSTDPKRESFTLQHIYLTPIDSEIGMEVLLEWSGDIELDLIASFKRSNEYKCTVSYLNNECGNVRQTASQRKKDSNKGVEMIAIDKIGNFNYEFYAHKFHSETVDFMKNHFAPRFWDEEVYTNSVTPIEKSKGKVKLYIPTFKFALINDFVPQKTSDETNKGMTWNLFTVKVTDEVLDFTINDMI